MIVFILPFQADFFIFLSLFLCYSGRRRRSSVESGLQRLQHLLEAAAEQDSQSVEQGSDESAPSLWVRRTKLFL